MTDTELVSKFNLSSNINYSELSKKITDYLASDEPNKVDTVMELIEIVNELDWELYQYSEILHQKRYSELYSSIISTYALNPKLGKVPTNLTQLDIKLRSEENTEKIVKIIDHTFIPLMLNLLLKFELDKQLLKILNIILVTRKICIKYHKKVKLTLDNDKFRRLKMKYYTEITYFGFTKPFTEDELRKEYKARALKVHPDRIGGDHSEFVKLKQYYDNLSKIFEK